jgi:hypothetical protein
MRGIVASDDSHREVQRSLADTVELVERGGPSSLYRVLPAAGEEPGR